ncbi:PAS domain-containing protein [Nocardioides sp. zg-579]|uniref:histidine kinase n=1 Tax=Nocardioides marmotae TaxID=2663857 RepID=A0A6I3JG88_9ACTN|nr:ATP-binding protein [Nocardioides marmotae]MCR6033688.1 PAS domain-containing protein [Gordonia jinghuaiqii]MTB97346.1 PAS domain-containing protein [Nocardioides marmotae]QKE01691.1 PAS domain-containing sensor histidine kinase [Nocardioides marmotae]
MDAQALADSLPDGVVVADADQQVELVSAPAARMLGVTPEEAVGRPLAEVLALRDQDGRAWVACNTPYAGLATRTGVPEQSWLLPDGTEVLVAARLHRDGVHQPVRRVAVTLRSGRGRARLDRERSDLVATVAHELRSPLTGVKGFVQALLNRWDKLNDDQKKLMLTTVSADADRLSRLIAELLDVARIDTGRLQLYPRPSDAAVLVTRIVESVQAGTARAVELVVDPHGDGLPTVHVDPDKFTQVVTNLVENGVRHGDGSVRVLVEAVAPGHETDPPGVRVTVDDEGEGIPEEMRRRVFTKFWKGGARGGSGLGLYLVHGLVRAHGGTVTIADAPGGGARLVTTWPSEDRRQE